MVRVDVGGSHRYRYTVERMYAGDPLYALGDFTTQPWNDEDDEEEDDRSDEAAADGRAVGGNARDVGGKEDEEEGEAGERGVGGEESGGTLLVTEAWGPDWNGDERYEELRARAAALTARRMERGRSGPFILSTTPRQAMVELQRLGWKAALAVALVPLGLAALLLWLRYA